MVLFGVAVGSSADAQTLKNTFGADVKKGAQAVEYRIGYTGDRGDGRDASAHRLHYQYAFTGSFQMRGILLQRWVEGDGPGLQAFGVESLFQILEDEDAGFDSALRFDVALADGDDRPSFLRAAWANEFFRRSNWGARAVLLAGREVGPQSESSPFAEVRLRGSYRFDAGPEVGLDAYHVFGYLETPGSFNDQELLVGPFLRFDLIEGLGLQLQYLGGISDAATDSQVRGFIRYRF